MCVKQNPVLMRGLDLLVDGVVVDTMQWDSCEFREVYRWYGAYLLLDLYCPDYLDYDGTRDWRLGLYEIQKVNSLSLSFDTSFPDLWLNIGSKFMQNESTYVQYYPEDRIVTGEGL